MVQTADRSAWTRQGQVAFLGACALLIVAPFEPLEPLLRLPWQKVTQVELAIAIALAAWCVAMANDPQRPALATPLTWPWLLLLVTLTLSALVAPAHQANALKTVARLAAAFLVFLLTVNAVATRRRLATAMAIAMGVGVIVSVLAVFEYLGLLSVRPWLNQFRDGVRVVGGQVRATATLQYPTIASMYLEILFAFALGLLVAAVHRRQWIAGAAVMAAASVLSEAIVLTFTRAGLVTMTSSLVLVAVWRYSVRGLDRAVVAVVAMAAIVLVVFMSSRSTESIRLRLTSTDRQNWYRATFTAPADVSMVTGSGNFLNVTVTNAGELTWRSMPDAPFKVSYHWIDDDTDRVIHYDGVRTDLPRPLAPGESTALRMYVDALHEPGRFRLVWDVVQENRLWFSAEPGAALVWTMARITGPVTTAPPAPHRPAPSSLPVPVASVGRSVLWPAALRMLAAHPLLGVGPDNFRLQYGPYAGVANPDERVHSNSMYLELLAGGGLVGGLVFVWLVSRGLQSVRRCVGQLDDLTLPLYSGIAAAGLAILLHGVVDSFLTFTPTYLLMAVTAGLALAPLRWTRTHAHRV